MVRLASQIKLLADILQRNMFNILYLSSDLNQFALLSIQTGSSKETNFTKKLFYNFDPDIIPEQQHSHPILMSMDPQQVKLKVAFTPRVILLCQMVCFTEILFCLNAQVYGELRRLIRSVWLHQ